MSYLGKCDILDLWSGPVDVFQADRGDLIVIVQIALIKLRQKRHLVDLQHCRYYLSPKLHYSKQ
jgi:hypothetical protein